MGLRKVVFEELATLMLWDPRDSLICLVMVGWKGKYVVKEGAVDLSCLLSCLRVSFFKFLWFLFDTVHFKSARWCPLFKEVV